MFSLFQSYNILFSSSYLSYILDWFHNFNCSLLLGVVIFVLLSFVYLGISRLILVSSIFNFQVREFVCTLLPAVILLFQIFPSLGLLYYFGVLDLNSDLRVKVTGHQWYWRYNVRDIYRFSFDSYIASIDSLTLGYARLIEVDSRCI